MIRCLNEPNEKTTLIMQLIAERVGGAVVTVGGVACVEKKKYESFYMERSRKVLK